METFIDWNRHDTLEFQIENKIQSNDLYVLCGEK